MTFKMFSIKSVLLYAILLAVLLEPISGRKGFSGGHSYPKSGGLSGGGHRSGGLSGGGHGYPSSGGTHSSSHGYPGGGGLSGNSGGHGYPSSGAWFWCLHLPLLFYVYGVGNFWYQWKFAQGAGDFVKSYVNVSIMILTANNSWWFLKQRPLLKAVLTKIDQNDRMARRSISLQRKHEKLMKIIKRIILVFYACNYIDQFLVYLPHRANVENSFSMTPCVGLQPLTSSPNREICVTILAIQEMTIMFVVLNYQTLLLFLIAHTAAMYQMMSYEMTALNDNYNKDENKALAKETLSSIIGRHTITLDVVDKLKSLYSVPLGVNFGTNAVCLTLFFYLPLQEWLQFSPILIYCFIVFFLYCFLGQRLINSSEVFERSVYCCGWENFDLREKKLVYVMLRQSQKPVELLAADIIPVNIYTFATTLQAIFKFITVVKF